LSNLAEKQTGVARASTSSGASVVRMPQLARTDEEIVRGVREGEAWAAAALLDRHGPLVERLIRRIMGHDPELSDLVHDAFATILASIDQVRDPQALKGWIASVAAHTAHHAIRRRRLSRWIFFWQSDEVPEEPVQGADHGAREAVQRMYAALDQLPADERVAFALRMIEEMPLEDVARACDVSLATIKRRLARAEQRFTAIARRDPVLKTWMDEGKRWT
jgi:RNA polymerase sigma-70 factor (ECF subfamily)